jgi:hypothetical protein
MGTVHDDQEPTVGGGADEGLGAGEGAGAEEDAGADGTQQVRAPWHFKVIVVGTVVYLAWRLYQGIGWLIHHL